MSAPFDVAARCRGALGSGPISPGRKLIVAESLGRDVGLDRIVGESVCPGRPDMPDEVELWLWLSWLMCEHVNWGASS